MCSTCGCNQPEGHVTIQLVGVEEETQAHDHLQTHSHNHSHEQSHGDHHGHTHSHAHGHEHHHHTHGPTSELIQLEKDILHGNNLMAERNRGYFEAKNISCYNLVSSPGSGKTSLLERTISDLKKEIPFFVVEGDQQTNNDAMRIHATGAPVVQVNTGKMCHLDSEMIHKAIRQLKPTDDSVLMIENVGNLVCPSLFDLGEAARIVIMSVTEGEDKPVKYPEMFHSSHLCIINKTDLLPYLAFDLEKAKNYALQVNHHLEIIELSATTGEGMEAWYQWLRKRQIS